MRCSSGVSSHAIGSRKLDAATLSWITATADITDHVTKWGITPYVPKQMIVPPL